MPKKVLIWGNGTDYDALLNNILFEVYKGNITVQALVCRQSDLYSSKKDGFKIIIKEEIKDVEYDYVVITSARLYKEIKKDAMSVGVPENKIISGQAFRLPLFDFKKYVSLIDNPVTILADDCWGGQVYHYLGLPFSTPLINIAWETEEFFKFIQDPVFYLKSDLQMVYFGDISKEKPPVGMLGEKEKNVKMNFIHCLNFNEAQENWKRRVPRINYNNIFIKGYIPSGAKDDEVEGYIEAYKNVPYKKVLFYYGDKDNKYSFKSDRFVWSQTNDLPIRHFHYNDYCRFNFSNDIDILSLLNGGEFSRYI